VTCWAATSDAEDSVAEDAAVMTLVDESTPVEELDSALVRSPRIGSSEVLDDETGAFDSGAAETSMAADEAVGVGDAIAAAGDDDGAVLSEDATTEDIESTFTEVGVASVEVAAPSVDVGAAEVDGSVDVVDDTLEEPSRSWVTSRRIPRS